MYKLPAQGLDKRHGWCAVPWAGPQALTTCQPPNILLQRSECCSVAGFRLDVYCPLPPTLVTPIRKYGDAIEYGQYRANVLCKPLLRLLAALPRRFMHYAKTRAVVKCILACLRVYEL